MRTRAFWIAAAERAIKTFAQSLLVVLGAGAFGLLDAPWFQVLSVAAMAGVLSLLSSVASINLGPGGTPSLVAEPSAIGPIARKAVAQLRAAQARRAT